MFISYLFKKIFDCTTYFNEPMLFEIRLNVLDKYVDEFIVADGKWRKDNTDFLQNLAGTAIAKGNFYGSTESG